MMSDVGISIKKLMVTDDYGNVVELNFEAGPKKSDKMPHR